MAFIFEMYHGVKAFALTNIWCLVPGASHENSAPSLYCIYVVLPMRDHDKTEQINLPF